MPRCCRLLGVPHLCGGIKGSRPPFSAKGAIASGMVAHVEIDIDFHLLVLPKMVIIFAIDVQHVAGSDSEIVFKIHGNAMAD